MAQVRRVLVAMSGGVDSSVAALLLKQDGYEVTGVTMKISSDDMIPTRRKPACFGEKKDAEIKAVKTVAEHLGIDFHVVDLRQEYEDRILNYFRQEYSSGRTPNPCVRCNAEIKFGLLLDGCHQLGLDFDYFATGHYARVKHDVRSGRWLLLKGLDPKKDQSYFLSLLSQEQLSRSLFPLGKLTKAEVRKIARDHNLPVGDKQESQDFYAGDYRDLLNTGKPGPIKDLSGRTIGQHNGIENYTVGQRRGLGVAGGQRLYVVRIEASNNTVYLGEEKDLLTEKFSVEGMNWIARLPKAGEKIKAKVKIRYKSPELDCRLIPEKGGQAAEVTLFNPYKAVTPGQVAVFYDGESVLAAGFIKKGDTLSCP